MNNRSRKDKQKEYNEKYGDIPKDYTERLNYMIDLYNISESKMNEIVLKRMNMQNNLSYIPIFITLYQIPEGMPRPRFRIIKKDNYMDAAIEFPQYIQVYSPGAQEDYRYFNKLNVDGLLNLHTFVQTPCIVNISSFFPTPKYFNTTDIFLAEMGLHRYDLSPDWDNIGKKYSDIYNDSVWLDDKLVISGTSDKYYSILPRVEIKLYYLNYATNKFQYSRIVNSTNYNDNFPISYLDNQGRPISNEH